MKDLMNELTQLENCNICPHNCNADRFSSNLGFCNTDAGFHISSICNHSGEEPIIGGKNGICNIFFAHCNLQCIYCQNYQISNNKTALFEQKLSLDTITNNIINLLNSGCKSVGFVSASHMVSQTKTIINALKNKNQNPVFVYNTNAYDKTDTLKSLEGYIDVYLPDFKYFDNEIAQEYSGIPDYPEIAKAALKEMYRQKGSTVIADEDSGHAESGLIIRHLVLPNHAEDSIKILRWIADELSTSVYISLMSQYYPTCNVSKHKKLNRSLYVEEYQKVVDELEKLGFYKGWIQEMDSQNHYRPDFVHKHPFEKN